MSTEDLFKYDLDFSNQKVFLEDTITLARRMHIKTGVPHYVYLDAMGGYQMRTHEQQYHESWDLVFSTIEESPDER